MFKFKCGCGQYNYNFQDWIAHWKYNKKRKFRAIYLFLITKIEWSK